MRELGSLSFRGLTQLAIAAWSIVCLNVYIVVNNPHLSYNYLFC
jgi:hypothetical protein